MKFSENLVNYFLHVCLFSAPFSSFFPSFFPIDFRPHFGAKMEPKWSPFGSLLAPKIDKKIDIVSGRRKSRPRDAKVRRLEPLGPSKSKILYWF